MRLTRRDTQIIHAVHACRVLRRDQIQQLFFPSQNTANARLQRLYQHGYLERRWCPVEFGQGTGQAIYLLGREGVRLLAKQLGQGSQAIGRPQANRVLSSPFLEHLMAVNDVRIAVTVSAERSGYCLERWVREDELKATRDYVHSTNRSGTVRSVAVIPDGYFVISLWTRRAHFFLELDRATESRSRWRQKVRAYLGYISGGRYTERFRTNSLRILVVTTGRKRLENLMRATEAAGGASLFWFSIWKEATASAVLTQPIWQVAGREGQVALVADQAAQVYAKAPKVQGREA